MSKLDQEYKGLFTDPSVTTAVGYGIGWYYKDVFEIRAPQYYIHLRVPLSVVGIL